MDIFSFQIKDLTVNFLFINLSTTLILHVLYAYIYTSYQFLPSLRRIIMIKYTVESFSDYRTDDVSAHT